MNHTVVARYFNLWDTQMLLFFLFLSSLAGFALMIFVDVYYIELLRSFLPYWMIAHLAVAVLIFLSVLIRYCWSKKYFRRFSSQKKLLRYLWLFVASLHAIVWWLFLASFLDTYAHDKTGTIILKEEWEVSILYANVFVDNRDVEELRQAVMKYDPDILLLVEFSDVHYRWLESYLQNNYTTINRLTWDQWYDGTLIASRYSFQELPRYIAGFLDLEPVVFDIAGQDVIMNIVHTASPVSERYFDLRNKQLEQIAGHVEKQFEDYPDASSVLLGDFNVTPWSLYYKRLLANLWTDWTASSADFGHIFTWYVPFFPLIKAHIDHAFVSSMGVNDLQALPIPWSDHYGLYFDITLGDD